jgi:hypothetical protein
MKHIKLFENFFSRIDFGNQLWVQPDWYSIDFKFRDDMWLIEIFDFKSQDDAKFACDGTDGLLLLWLEEWVKKLR